MIVTDVVIVGAGPVGLFQVFELGLLDLRAHVIDSMPRAGGQCIELYPDKPIYDIPAIPRCSAQELIERLLEQIRPFGATLHLGEEVTALERRPNRRFHVRTSLGKQFDCAAVIVAGGVGSFRPRQLSLPGAESVTGRQLHYKVTDATLLHGRDVVIAGAGDSALDWALALYEHCNVVLLHRSREFRAQAGKVKQVERLCAQMKMQFLEGEICKLDLHGDALQAVHVRQRSGLVNRLPLDHLLVFWGLHPKLGPIASWGLGLDKNQIEVDTAHFSSNVPGIFAVGDINIYPGKKKLILSGFHEAALAAFGVREFITPGEKVHLQYTTTSPALQRRLGVRAAPSTAAAET